MSETDTYWFHCGACGKLFSSEVDFSDDRECPHCGEHPSPSLQAAPPVQDARTRQEPVNMASKPLIDGRRPRRLRTLHKVLVAWLVFMAIAFGVAHMVKERTEDERKAAKDSPGDELETIHPDQQLIDQALPQCREVLDRFLATESVAQRLPLALPHPELQSHMERYYEDNQLLSVVPDSLELQAATKVELPEGDCILTQWETSEGASFDAAFRQVEGQWRLDWHHFVRYSDLSWPMFVAGSGEDEALFRLHARRRQGIEGDPRNGIGVVLSAPMRRQMDQVGYSQSMMGLSLNEEDGQLLEQAFEREAQGQSILGAGLRDLNPEGMIRVHVRVQRIGEEGGTAFRITEVLACHWYDSEATGLE